MVAVLNVTTKLAFAPAIVETLPMLIVGITINVAVPVVAPANAFTIDDKLIVKFLPPPLTCVVTLGKVKVVCPAGIVAEPLSDE